MILRKNGGSGKIEIVDVEKVVDGDTFVLTDGRICRLIGINAPEIGEKGSKKALNVLEMMILGQKIIIEICPVRPTDKYQRIRVLVTVHGYCVNEALLFLGVVDVMDKQPCHVNAHRLGCMDDIEIQALENFTQAARQKYNGKHNIKGDRIGDIKTGVYHILDCYLVPDRPRQILFHSESHAENWGYARCPMCGG